MLDALDAATAEDTQLVVQRYAELLEELRDKGLVYWDANAIPLLVFSAVTKIMIGRVCLAFQEPEPSMQDDDGATVSVSLKGLKDLRRHMQKRVSGEPVQTDYY